MNCLSEDSRELISLLENREFAKAHAWLNRLPLLQLEGKAANLCLTAALHATPNLFRKVLSRCPSSEYSGRLALQPRPGVRAYVSGTLLTLAAALNKPEHVKSLLAAGYDPNSAGVASAAAFDHVAISNEWAAYGDRCAVGENRINFTGKANWSLGHITPLGAAIACGSREAAAVLLRCPGVWKAESGVVCRAAVSALQMFGEDPGQELAGMVFGNTRGKAFCPREFLRSCDLQMEYAADFCAFDLLETQIESGFFDEAGARTALRIFESGAMYGRSFVRARIRKMTLLAKKFTNVCREPWATGLFLRELVRRFDEGQPHQRLLKRWKALSGEEGDLTWAQVELYRISREKLQKLLKELKREIPLVMDADGLAPFGKEAKGELMDILSHAKLRHNTGLEGISGLAMTLINIGELRYLRKAAGLGAFGEEDPKALLKYLQRRNRNDLRVMMLACGGQAQKPAEPRWKSECRENLWSRHWEIDGAAYGKWLTELMEEELPEEECLRRLQVMRCGSPVPDFWQRDCTIEVRLPESSQRSEIHVRDPEAALCCGSQIQPLQLMERYMPQRLRKRFYADFMDRELMNLEGTPLALAAAAGRTELVRFWLEQGVDPDETGNGVCSFLQWFGSDALPLTPVMAAIYYGEEETAALLLEAGAVCDFSKPVFRKLLERGNERTLEVAGKLPGTGFEDIPAEWLEDLREKGLFWEVRV